jgi:hypothetical protein
MHLLQTLEIAFKLRYVLGEVGGYNVASELFFDNWGRLVSTGQGRLVVARRGCTLAS